MKTKNGGNVHRGCYSDLNASDKGGVTQGNGKFGRTKMLTDTHRLNDGVPKFKGHHFKGKTGRGTGKVFK